MSRKRRFTSLEKLAMGFFGALSLVGLLGMLGFALSTGSGDQFEPWTAGLCFGPFAGSLGAMALIWLRRRTEKLNFALVGAIVMWFIGMTMLGLGVFAAFTPGDHTILQNFGYSVSICFAPGLIFSLLAIGAYWYSELRGEPEQGQPAEPGEHQAENTDGSAPAAVDYGDIERRAADYKRRIIMAVRQRKNGPLKDALRPVLDKIDDWEDRVHHLTRWLAAFDRDTATQRDLRETPLAIGRLRQQIASETDPEVEAQMNDTLAGYVAQQARLDELQSAARQTRLQLEEALSAMGLIYSQLQLLAVKELDNDSARRISEDIQEQTNRLDDLLSSVSEVYAPGEIVGEAEAGQGSDDAPVAKPRLDAAAGG
jgi:hypothetical protein